MYFFLSVHLFSLWKEAEFIEIAELLNCFNIFPILFFIHLDSLYFLYDDGKNDVNAAVAIV